MATINKYINENTNIGDKNFVNAKLRVYNLENESINESVSYKLLKALEGNVTSVKSCNYKINLKNCNYYSVLYSTYFVKPQQKLKKLTVYGYKLENKIIQTEIKDNFYLIKDTLKENLIWSKGVFKGNFWVEVDLTDDISKVVEVKFVNGYKEDLKVKSINLLNVYGIQIKGINIGDVINPNTEKVFNIEFLYFVGLKELYQNKLTIEFENGVKVSYILCAKRNYAFLPPMSNKSYTKALFDQTRFFNRTLNLAEIDYLSKEVSFFEINNKNVQFSYGIELPEIEIIETKIITEEGFDKLNVKYRVLNPVVKSPIKLAGEGIIEGE